MKIAIDFYRILFGVRTQRLAKRRRMEIWTAKMTRLWHVVTSWRATDKLMRDDSCSVELYGSQPDSICDARWQRSVVGHAKISGTHEQEFKTKKRLKRITKKIEMGSLIPLQNDWQPSSRVVDRHTSYNGTSKINLPDYALDLYYAYICHWFSV